MPIKGLTDETDSAAGLPCIARLYKGDEKEKKINSKGKEYEVMGRDLDYFRVEFEPPYDEPQYEYVRQIWLELYGDKPTEFEPVMLAAATVEEAFQSWKEDWTATTMLHRCDGEHQKNWFNPDTQTYMTAKIACAAPKCQCKPVGRMRLLLPEFIQAAGVMGYISVSTHSLYDILTVHRYLSFIQSQYNRLTGVPFIFGRAEREVSAPKQVKQGNDYVKSGRIKVAKSLFYMHVTSDFTQTKLLPVMAGQISPPEPARLSPSADEARQRLGNGGSRRLGGYLPSESEVPQDVEPEPIPDFELDENDRVIEEQPLDPAEPVNGQRETFAIVGFQTRQTKFGKPFYSLRTHSDMHVLAYSRDVFRHWGYNDAQVKNWDKPGFSIGFNPPLQIDAQWKENPDGSGNWVVLLPDPVTDGN